MSADLWKPTSAHTPEFTQMLSEEPKTCLVHLKSTAAQNLLNKLCHLEVHTKCTSGTKPSLPQYCVMREHCCLKIWVGSALILCPALHLSSSVTSSIPPLPSFIWMPQWGLFVQWLPLHCAARGSWVNGQANEFSPSANCGVSAHTLWCTYMCKLKREDAGFL